MVAFLSNGLGIACVVMTLLTSARRFNRENAATESNKSLLLSGRNQHGVRPSQSNDDEETLASPCGQQVEDMDDNSVNMFIESVLDKAPNATVRTFATQAFEKMSLEQMKSLSPLIQGKSEEDVKKLALPLLQMLDGPLLKGLFADVKKNLPIETRREWASMITGMLEPEDLAGVKC